VYEGDSLIWWVGGAFGPQLMKGALVKPMGMSARWIVQHEIIFGDFFFA